MEIKITLKELEMRAKKVAQELLSSNGFDNPKFFDGEFVSHGIKKEPQKMNEEIDTKRSVFTRASL